MRIVPTFFLVCLLVGTLGCTTFPNLVKPATPCDTLLGWIKGDTSRTELHTVAFQRDMSLEEAIACVGEPEWTLGQVWEGRGWSYTLELWYPTRGFSITGRTDHLVADFHDEHGTPDWVDTTILFENPKAVIPAHLPIIELRLTAPALPMEEFRAIVLPLSTEVEWHRDYLNTVRPWSGWETIEPYDPLRTLEPD